MGNSEYRQKIKRQTNFDLSRNRPVISNGSTIPCRPLVSLTFAEKKDMKPPIMRSRVAFFFILFLLTLSSSIHGGVTLWYIYDNYTGTAADLRFQPFFPTQPTRTILMSTNLGSVDIITTGINE